jgi:hypothetical protein
MTTTRRYLSKRDLAEPVKAASRTREILSDWQTLQIGTALGAKFRHHARVALRRPAWMPGPLFRCLLRSIVIETQNEERDR